MKNLKKISEQLDEIKQSITCSNMASGLASGATQLVFGGGSPTADVMIIGEAPGKKEDETGQPFVGAAGKLLDELLASISIERESVYITNLVKYRPPNNRDPLPSEKEAFLPYLLEQIRVIDPKVLVTLGRHSMEQFLPGSRISHIHGQPNIVRLSILSGNDADRDTTLVPLYHPAAALYNPALRETLFNDIAVLPHIIKQETFTKNSIKGVKSI